MASKAQVTSKVAKKYQSMVDAVANRPTYGNDTTWYRQLQPVLRKVS